MQIILNPDLKEALYPREADRVVQGFEYFTRGLSRKLDKIEGKDYKLLNGIPDFNLDPAKPGFSQYQVNYLELMSNAYSAHRKIEIAPHDLWFIVLSELAAVIKANKDRLRHLFTTSAEKKTIQVDTNDVTKLDLNLVVAQLRDLVPTDIDVFVPDFSTHTPESRLACYAGLCDAMQVYYSYETRACGLPELRITGSKEDWLLFHSCLQKLSGNDLLGNIPGVTKWLYEVQAIILEFVHVTGVQAPDLSFWKDVFSKNNVGSGGEFVISGWITKLFMYKPNMFKLENFSAALATVPYKNVDTGREFTAVYGALKGIRTEDGFMKAGYTGLVFEHMDAVPKAAPTPYTIEVRKVKLR